MQNINTEKNSLNYLNIFAHDYYMTYLPDLYNKNSQ